MVIYVLTCEKYGLLIVEVVVMAMFWLYEESTNIHLELTRRFYINVYQLTIFSTLQCNMQRVRKCLVETRRRYLNI